ncbi:MAG: respiratory nitrate reductase subunit gamma [Deltaproteobacteria bacterium]|nr:respiratory nitrate reductase subunit gamma [Deltaproteobacteria bacterium]
MVPFRSSYWHIEPVWVFYLLAALSVGIFAVGLFMHLRVWLKGIRRGRIGFSPEGISRVILDGLLGRRIFRGDFSAGLMHLLILWGFLGLFIGTVLISVDYWIVHFLQGGVYLWYSLLLEVLGLMLLAGLLWALVRRYLQRVSRLERRWEDLLVVAWLVLVALTGFLAEGARLGAQRPPWKSWSFAGHLLGGIWTSQEGALSVYPLLWWVHALVSLAFIAFLPYSKVFHALAAPVSIYLEGRPPEVASLEERGEGQEIYSLHEMVFLDACTRCGRCVEVCPSAGSGEPFSPRDFVLWARMEMQKVYAPLLSLGEVNAGGFDAGRIWHCTTCRACLEVCPVYVATPDAIRDRRVRVVEEGREMPALLSQSLKNVYKYNNPWEASKKRRGKWSEDVAVEIADLSRGNPEGLLCYFVGCTTSLETRAQELARSFARVLGHAGVAFGTLGKKEPCCGDIARRAGEDGLFQMKMEDCTSLLEEAGIRELVTSSPHCFHTMSKEYPLCRDSMDPGKEQGFRVRHYTQVLRDLLASGSLRFEGGRSRKVTYHDPCYLGRHNGIYDAPREVLRAVPGVELVEMAHCREGSLCCGGGGDRMWQDELDGKVKMSEVRIREAEATGAEVVVTACPLCLIMLEDARKTAGLEERLRVMDLNEFLVEALGLEAQETRS